MEKKNIYMKIFDKQFKVELISFEDKSTKEKTYRKVIFKADREVYHYIYEGTLSYVVKDTGEEVYSPFKCIENGSYYEEIGRKLSIQQRATDIDKVFGKMPEAKELLEEKKNNLFSGYSEKAKEIFENNICVESDQGYLLIKAQDVLDAIEEALKSKRESDGVRGKLQELINMITADKYPKMDGSHRIDHSKAIKLIIQINNEL